MKYYYKVVTKNMESVSVKERSFGLKYKLNTTIKPKLKKSKIFIFRKLIDAVDFAKPNNFSGKRIFRCIVTNPKRLKVRSFLDVEKHVVEKFWENFTGQKDIYTSTSSPFGTYGADSVKLVSEVK